MRAHRRIRRLRLARSAYLEEGSSDSDSLVAFIMIVRIRHIRLLLCGSPLRRRFQLSSIC